MGQAHRGAGGLTGRDRMNLISQIANTPRPYPIVEQALGKRGFEGPVDGLLGHPGGRTRHLRDRRRHRVGLGQQFIGRDHPGYQADAVGLGGVDGAPGQDHVHRLGLPHRAGQTLRATHARQYTQLDFGLPELGGVGGDQHVAHHGQFAATTERMTGNRGDQRCADGCEPAPRGEEVRTKNVGEGQRGHLLDIGARREGLGRSGDDDGADTGIRIEFCCRSGDFGHHLTVQSVESLRPVQCDGADPLRPTHQDGLVIHVSSLSGKVRSGSAGAK